LWPEAYREGNFQITVLGESPIFPELKIMAEKKMTGGRKFEVSTISDIAEFKKCHILFVSHAWSSRFQDVLSKVSEEGILIITEQPGLGAKGSGVNFITKDGKLTFELNQSALGKYKLKASAELARLAVPI
jgi:hypothetical protein